MKIVIATIKSWNIENAKKLKKKYEGQHDILVLTEKDQLTENAMNEFLPDYIFFPHWSEYIPATIYEKYNCVVFHMTDLPYGRGGSPLQNLIVRGHRETVISAIKVTKGLDEGPIYMKTPLNLDGSADEIFKRASGLIFEQMIPQFMEENLVAVAQQGEATLFKRRTPSESELQPEFGLEKIYDYIRMLDAEGYPNAFIMLGNHRIEFEKAQLDGEVITAQVRISKEKVNNNG